MAGRTHLLEGEDQDSADPADADRWVRIYTDPVGYTSLLTEVTGQHLATMSETAREVVEHVDEAMLRLQRQRHLRRLDYWTTHRRDLER